MKNIINVVLMGVILFCLIYPQVTSSIPLDPARATTKGIFDSIGDELSKEDCAFTNLVEVYTTINESTSMTLGHPIHEIEGLENFGTELGEDIEDIVDDASADLTDKQRKQLSKLFKSKEIK